MLVSFRAQRRVGHGIRGYFERIGGPTVNAGRYRKAGVLLHDVRELMG
jgi:hypothetical protein